MQHPHEKFKDEFWLLCEAGFIAVNQADADAATKLFKASQLLRPNSVMPQIGFGYMHMCKLELAQACKCFEEVLRQEPHHEMAQTFLGLSLCLTTQEVAKGEIILEHAAMKSGDPTIKKLASSAIEFVEKFIKTPKSPLHGPAPKKGKAKHK